MYDNTSLSAKTGCHRKERIEVKGFSFFLATVFLFFLLSSVLLSHHKSIWNEIGLLDSKLVPDENKLNGNKKQKIDGNFLHVEKSSAVLTILDIQKQLKKSLQHIHHVTLSNM